MRITSGRECMYVGRQCSAAMNAQGSQLQHAVHAEPVRTVRTYVVYVPSVGLRMHATGDASCIRYICFVHVHVTRRVRSRYRTNSDVSHCTSVLHACAQMRASSKRSSPAGGVT